VDEHSPDADALRGNRYAAQRVRENVGAEPLAGMFAADGQPADDRDGNRVRRVAPNLAGRGRVSQ
jgi:hypothetical protein